MGRRKAELIGRISYRLTAEDFKLAEDAGRDLGVSVHELGRQAILEKLKTRSAGPDSWESFRLLAQIRFLLGHGLRLLASDNLTAKEWERLRSEAERSAAAIADDLLKRGKE